MKEATLKVTLSEEASLKKEWEQHFNLDLPSLLQALKIVKLSINEHLSHLLCQQKDLVPNDQEEHSDFEEDIKDDISGFIKHVNTIHERPVQREKRKVNYSNEAKKVRK